MNGKTFGFRKPQEKKYLLNYIKRVNLVYTLFLLMIFGCFNFYNHFGKIVFADDKMKILESSLQDMAVYFWPIDKNISQSFLAADKLKTNYMQGKDILNENKSDILYLFNYFQQHSDYITKFGFVQYKGFIDFVSQSLNYKDDIFSLLGKDGPQTYLIVFQNMSEKRPNGGFFGSFGVLKLDHMKVDFKVLDSYYIDYISSGNYLTIPDWADNFLEDPKLYFVSVNKFGFTDIDGQNIKTLYEQATHENIRGVVFLKSDLIEDIIPGFQYKLLEWQFVNASVDLIRGKNLPFKKELYIKDLTDYLQKTYKEIIKNFAGNFDSLISSNYIDVYLTGVSQDLQQFIVNKNLTTVYESNKIYVWDSNIAFNKIDRFVHKNIQLLDSKGNILTDTGNEILDIQNLPAGKYTLSISYNINIPKWYLDFIEDMQKKYNIQLTRRENYIFGLNYTWNSRGLIYLPKDISVLSVNGDNYYTKQFENPFSQTVVYKVKSQENNKFRQVKIDFIKKE